MNNERKKNWRRNLKDVLEEISSKEFQEKIWVKGESQKIVSSMTEAICTFFDDLNLREGLDWAKEEGFLDDDEIKILLPFYKKFNKYVDNLSNIDLYDNTEKIINSPEWEEIRQEAKKSFDKLKIEDYLPIMDYI